ncbi:GM25930 [Drosophila sechellia]|uniref:GM25930 n=1 Tax=Drosophila sechellia TaxID=7238 RepID=B4HFS1_DROSE|nr:GM25930 [Drosophila sechellia]
MAGAHIAHTPHWSYARGVLTASGRQSEEIHRRACSGNLGGMGKHRNRNQSTGRLQSVATLDWDSDADGLIAYRSPMLRHLWHKTG